MRLSPEATAFIEKAYKLVSDFNEMEELIESDISLLVPRLPQEMLFVIGGWIARSPSALFQTFDMRAERWSEFDEFSIPDGPRSYHSAAVLGNKVYCIGGGNPPKEFHNKCSVFDVVTKTWTEVKFLGRFPFEMIRKFTFVTKISEPKSFSHYRSA